MFFRQTSIIIGFYFVNPPPVTAHCQHPKLFLVSHPTVCYVQRNKRKSSGIITFSLSLRRTGVQGLQMVLKNKTMGVMMSLGACSRLCSRPCAGSQQSWAALFIRQLIFLLLIKDFKTLTLTGRPSVLRHAQPPFLYSQRVHPEVTTCFIWSCVVASLVFGTFCCHLLMKRRVWLDLFR